MRKAVKERTRISHCSGSQTVNTAGFSLVELLVALILLVAALTLVPPYFSKGLSSAEFKQSVRLIAAGLRTTQSLAIAGNREKRFILDVENRLFSIGDDGPSNQLPTSLLLKLRTAESEKVGESIGGIRFFPDGSSTGGTITISSDGLSQILAVDWITGKITINEAE